MVFTDAGAAVLFEIGKAAVEGALGCGAVPREVGEMAMVPVGPVGG